MRLGSGMGDVRDRKEREDGIGKSEREEFGKEIERVMSEREGILRVERLGEIKRLSEGGSGD